MATIVENLKDWVTNLIGLAIASPAVYHFISTYPPDSGDWGSVLVDATAVFVGLIFFLSSRAQILEIITKFVDKKFLSK